MSRLVKTRADEIKEGDEFLATVMGGSEIRVVTQVEKLPNGKYAITSEYNLFMPVAGVKMDVFNPDYEFRNYEAD